MNKVTEKGFAVVEALIILLVLVLLGGAGWYVYQRNYKTEQSTTSNNSNTTNSAAGENVEQTEQTDLYAGWKTYVSEKEGLTISYPESWTYKDNKGPGVFDSFTLTGPGGFVITCTIATIPLDGGEDGRKVVFVDEIKDANYLKPLYVVGHYSPEYNNLDTISVTTTKFTAGETNVGPRGYFPSKITEKMNDIGSNYVYLQGAFPNYKTIDGYDASPLHKDFASGDLKTARQILNTVKYE